MSWQFSAAVRGNLAEALKADEKAAAGAVTSVMRKRAAQLKGLVRQQISGAGLGQRLGNSARDQVFPIHGESINAKGRVVSKAIYKRPGGLVDLFTVFDEGAVIHALGGKFMAIPVGVGKKEKLSNFDRKDIEILPFRNGQGYVVLRRGARAFGRGGGGVLFLLIKQATIKKRLDLQAALDAASEGIDEAVAAEWTRRADSAGIVD